VDKVLGNEVLENALALMTLEKNNEIGVPL